MKYRGWTISCAWIGYVATHDDKFDGESATWQINANTLAEIKELIDEKEEEG